MEKQQIYRDSVHEAQTRTELQNAQTALQHLLDVWNALDLKPCDDLFMLTQQPQAYHSKVVGDITEVPVSSHGRYQLRKDVYLQLLDIPVPNQLYVAARDARKQSFTGVKQLWSISPDGKSVEMNQEAASTFVDARSIYTNNEVQAEFVKYVEQYVSASNWLHDRIINLPGLNTLYSLPWQIEARSFPTLCKLSMSPPQLNEILKSLQ